ncbi:MAG TPA: polysaccharide pyruvyl transferase family protein [Peptococcaceae bacterium]|nr:polysaccharide pyruvyl transferase family protein [Peptococcaceae bacterium]
MKIGILTFHRSYNYGAILQAYALTKKLKDLGADPKIIDFRNEDIEAPTKLVIKGEKIDFKTPVRVIFRYIRHKRINNFINSNIPLSQPVRDENDFRIIEKEYDRYITGSDQIWNNTHIKGKKCFFLDFVSDNRKKYSYAASIGGDLKKAKETVKLYSKYIDQYQVISLRENNIKEYFQSLYGDKVRCDVDPVLLLSKEQWSSIASPRLHKNKYIFMYLVPSSSHIHKFARNFAKRNGWDLINNKSSKEFFNHCGIEDFLSWLYNAEAIVTNSFHGTAFSILFQKEFYVELNANIGFNFRSNQLLEAVGINSVEITSDNPPAVPIRHDYTKINQKLEVLRENSLDYLKSIIKESNN